MARRLATCVLPAVVIALLINVGLFALGPLLSRDRQPPRDTDSAVGVNLMQLAAPEPPVEEEVKEPQKPQQQESLDFAPDLLRPELSPGSGLDLGIAIDLGGLRRDRTDGAFVFNAADLDQPPQPAVRVPPAYPYKAKQLGVIGAVKVKMLVLADGSVDQVRVLDAQPAGMFEDSVLKTLPSWRYTPGRVKGKPVTSWVVTTIRFDLT